MHFISPVFDLYSDYLLVNQGQTTATGLSTLVEGKLSHDAITRSLHQQAYGSAQLWQVVRPFVEQIADPNAVLTLDDTVEAKAYMDQNPLIRFHYDHCQQKALKGINQLTALYTGKVYSLPVAYELIQKDEAILDQKTGKTKWVSGISKQERFRRLIRQSLANKLIFRYILADSWFSSAENFTYISRLDQHFIMPLKSNRKVALSKADRSGGPATTGAVSVDRVIEYRSASMPCRLGGGSGFSALADQAGLQRRGSRARNALSGNQ